MSQQTRSYPGIPCLYYYVYKTGLKRFFVKTQIHNHVYRINLDVPDNPSKIELRTQVRRAIAQLKKQNHSDKTFHAYVEEYIVVHQLCEKTAKAYRSILSRYSFDDQKNAAEIQRTLESKINACQIARTVNAFFNWLIRNSVRIVNPAANIKIPKSRIRTRTLSRSEIKQFFEALDTADAETALFGHLLLETGARVSTINAIQCGDLVPDGIQLKNIKSDRPYRLPIPIRSVTRSQIEHLIHDRSPKTRLFTLSIHTLTSHIRAILDKLFNTNPCKERIVIHSLRHTVATLAIQNGTSIETVSRMLDHVNLNTTYQIYANINQKQLEQGYDRLFRIL